MSDVQLYLIEPPGSDNARKIAQQTALKLQAKDIKLVALVESLAAYINDDNLDVRCRAITYLADVLDSTPPRLLTLQQRTLLSDFVVSRIQDDPESIKPCTRALLALESTGKWSSETVTQILTTLVEATHPLRRFKLQAERYAILTLIDLLLAHYRPDITALADRDPAFVVSFIAYLDGEKDPRNLMIVFSILQVPMAEWPLGDNTQELFDSVFNYFPITFKPPPGDPYGITAQQLKDRLKDCISATSAFAPFAFPALLDKLDSTSLNTKRDVLAALSACITHYDPKIVSTHAVTIWDAVKSEILNIQEADLVQDHLDLLTLLTARLSQSHLSGLSSLLKPIVSECNTHFEDAPTKQSQLSARILASVMQADWHVAELAIKATLPNLFALHDASDSSVKRRGVIEVLNVMLHTSQILSATWQTRDEQGVIIRDQATSNALKDFTSDLFRRLFAAVDSSDSERSLRLAGLEGLTTFVVIPALIESHDLEKLVVTATRIAMIPAVVEADDVLAAAMKLLVESAKQSPDVVTSQAIPVLYADIPDCPESSSSSYTAPLESLVKLSVEPQIANVIIQRLRSKLTAALHQSAPQTFINAVLTALLYVFAFGSPAKEDGVIRVSYLWDMAKPLLEQAMALAPGNDQLQSQFAIDILARICQLIIRPQSNHLQNQICHTLESLLDVSRPASDETWCRKLTCSLYLHAAFHRDVLDEDTVLRVLSSLKTAALSTEAQTATSHVALRHLTLVINKFIPAGQVDRLLSTSGLDTPSLLDPPTPSSLRLAFAVVSGLVLRTDAKSAVSLAIPKLCTILSSDLGPQAAPHFSTLLAQDEILSKPNHCLINGLYKQRVYSLVHAQILALSADAPTAHKKCALVALLGVLKQLPYGIIQPTIESISTLLLQSLDLQASSVASALIVLESVLLYDPKILETHVSSLVSRLLNAAAESLRAETREKALVCLALVAAQFKREALLPYRRGVVKKLLGVLDDQRRKVRAQGVRSRSAWLGLDADDDDDNE